MGLNVSTVAMRFDLNSALSLSLFSLAFSLHVLYICMYIDIGSLSQDDARLQMVLPSKHRLVQRRHEVNRPIMNGRISGAWKLCRSSRQHGGSTCLRHDVPREPNTP